MAERSGIIIEVQDDGVQRFTTNLGKAEQASRSSEASFKRFAAALETVNKAAATQRAKEALEKVKGATEELDGGFRKAFKSSAHLWGQFQSNTLTRGAKEMGELAVQTMALAKHEEKLAQKAAETNRVLAERASGAELMARSRTTGVAFAGGSVNAAALGASGILGGAGMSSVGSGLISAQHNTLMAQAAAKKVASKQAQEDARKEREAQKELAEAEHLRTLRMQGLTMSLGFYSYAAQNVFQGLGVGVANAALLGAAFGLLESIIRNVTAGLRLLTSTIVNLGLHAAKTGDDIQTIAERAGASTTMISGLRLSAAQANVSMEMLETAITTLVQRATSTPKVFEDFKVSIRNANGNIKNGDELLRAYADRMKEAGSASERAAVAVALTGRSGKASNVFFAEGSAGLDAYIEKARKFGGVVSDAAIKATVATQDSLDELSQVFEAVRFDLGVALGPALNTAIEGIKGYLTELLERINENKEGISAFALKATADIASLGAVLARVTALMAKFAIGTVLLTRARFTDIGKDLVVAGAAIASEAEHLAVAMDKVQVLASNGGVTIQSFTSTLKENGAVFEKPEKGANAAAAAYEKLLVSLSKVIEKGKEALQPKASTKSYEEVELARMAARTELEIAIQRSEALQAQARKHAASMAALKKAEPFSFSVTVTKGVSKKDLEAAKEATAEATAASLKADAEAMTSRSEAVRAALELAKRESTDRISYLEGIARAEEVFSRAKQLGITEEHRRSQEQAVADARLAAQRMGLDEAVASKKGEALQKELDLVEFRISQVQGVGARAISEALAQVSVARATGLKEEVDVILASAVTTADALRQLLALKERMEERGASASVLKSAQTAIDANITDRIATESKDGLAGLAAAWVDYYDNVDDMSVTAGEKLFHNLKRTTEQMAEGIITSLIPTIDTIERLFSDVGKFQQDTIQKLVEKTKDGRIVREMKNANKAQIDAAKAAGRTIEVITETTGIKQITVWDKVKQSAIGAIKSMADAIIREFARIAAAKVVLGFFNLISGGVGGTAVSVAAAATSAGVFGSTNFSEGGLVPEYLAGGGFPGRPRGTDTIPAWLTPKERVLSVSQNKSFERRIERDSAVETRLARIESSISNISAGPAVKQSNLIFGGSQADVTKFHRDVWKKAQSRLDRLAGKKG